MDSRTVELKDHNAEEAAALDYLVEPPEEGGEERAQQGGVNQEGQPGLGEGHPASEGRKHTHEGAVPQGEEVPGSAQQLGAQSSQVPNTQQSAQSGEVHAIIPHRISKRPRNDREEEQSKRVRFKERKEDPGRSKTRRMDSSPLPLRLLVRSAVYEDITVVVARDATISQLKSAIEEQSNGRLKEAFSPMLLLGKMPLLDNLLTLKRVGIIQDDTVIGFLPKDTRAFIQSAGLRPLHQVQENAPAASLMPRPSPTGEAAARALVGLGNLTAEGYANGFPSPPVAQTQASQKKRGAANPSKERTSILETFTLPSSSLLGPRLDPSQLPPGYYQVSPAELLMKGMSAAARRPVSSNVKRRSPPLSNPPPPGQPQVPVSEVPPQANPPSAEPKVLPPPEPKVAASAPSGAVPSQLSAPPPEAPLFPLVSGASQTSEHSSLEYLPSHTPPMSTAFAQTAPPGSANVDKEDSDWEQHARAAAMRKSNPPANDFSGGETQMDRPPDSVLGRDDGDWDKQAQQMATRGNQWLRMEGDARYAVMRPFETVAPAQSEAFGSPSEAVPPAQSTPGPSSLEYNPPEGDDVPLKMGPSQGTPPSDNGFGSPQSEGTPLEDGQQWQLALSDSKGLRQKQSAGEQRRARRLFTVGEVEALVTAVERLGTGRWREVKQRAFPLAKHRTYADLKDKWKTLVRTAQIAPSQRRGNEIPEELLERVTRAHAFWRRQAQFDERYYAEYGMSMQGLPYSPAMQDGGAYGLHPYPGQDPPPPLMEEIRDPQGLGELHPGDYQHAQMRSPHHHEAHPSEEFRHAEGRRGFEEQVSGPPHLYAPQPLGDDLQLAGHASAQIQEAASTPLSGDESAFVEEGGESRGFHGRGEAFGSGETGGQEGNDQAGGALGDYVSSRPLANTYVASSGVESIRAAYGRQVSSEAPLDGYRRGPPTLYENQISGGRYAEVASIAQERRIDARNFNSVNGVEATEASGLLDSTKVQNGSTYGE